MHNDTLQQELIRLEQMIHDLKQAKNAGTMISVFTYNDDSGDGGKLGTHKINFEAGSQPIITEIFSGTNITLFAPEGNSQYYYALSQGLADVTIISTRKILSVEYLGL